MMSCRDRAAPRIYRAVLRPSTLAISFERKIFATTTVASATFGLGTGVDYGIASELSPLAFAACVVTVPEQRAWDCVLLVASDLLAAPSKHP